MRHLAILSTSLNEASKSRQLARLLRVHAEADGVPVTFVDLQERPLPLSGPNAGWDDPVVQTLKAELAPASHVAIAVPIYNYDVNAAAKNAIELAGEVFTDKVVGFLCAAGGSHSYMSVMSLANSLMLDFRTVIAPRFVYAEPEDWLDAATLRPDTQARLEGLLRDLRRIQVG